MKDEIEKEDAQVYLQEAGCSRLHHPPARSDVRDNFVTLPFSLWLHSKQNLPNIPHNLQFHLHSLVLHPVQHQHQSKELQGPRVFDGSRPVSGI